MADRTRDEKLAAAKKKLQQFTKKKKGIDNNQKDIPITETQKNTIDKNLNNGHSRNSSDTTSSKGDNAFESHKCLSTIHNVPKIAKCDDHPSVNKVHESNIEPSKETESLREFCRHINGILDRDSAEEQSPMDIIQELEKQNHELAEILERKEVLLEQVTSQLADLKAQNQRLSKLAEDQNISQDTLNKLKTELSAWQQQCDAQNITINSLTSEKNNLQTTLADQKHFLQAKVQENEDLSAKLKASRERVGDLEKKAQSTKSSGEVGEHARKQMSMEADRLRSELTSIKTSRDELFQVNSELKSRLSTVRQDKATLELTVDDLKKQLELSQVYVHQLTNQNQTESQDEVEQLKRLESDNKSYQTRLSEYSTALDHVTQERDRLTKQYRSYLEQLEKNASEMTKQIELLSKERDAAGENITALKKQLENKEKQIQAVDQRTEQVIPPSQDRTRQLIASYESEMEELRQENTSFRERIDAQLRDNSHLSQMCEEKEARCLELESSVARFQEERVDKNKLLSEIQSDKTALSRALAQNRQLKMQLTELQEAFVKLSNDNMDLLSDYQHEQHVAKELAVRLGQQEDELKEIRQLLSRKDDELRTLRQNYHNVTEEMFADANDDEDDDEDPDSSRSFSDKSPPFKKTRRRQLSDVKHHRHLAEKLQKELSAAQLAISKLTNQNNELRSRVNKTNSSSDNVKEQNENGTAQSGENLEISISPLSLESNIISDGISNDTIASLLASVSQLEAERDQLLLEVESARQDQLKHSITDSETKDIVPRKDYLDLKNAMTLLERRLKTSLECQAQLEDTNSQLEHSIGQLESETDTIGEYILLYQEQRFRLRERTLAREQYIQRLSHERESLRSKLKQLQELVVQLLSAQGDNSTLIDLIDNHTELSSRNCKLVDRVTSTPLSVKDSDVHDLNGAWPDLSDSEESVVEAFVPMMTDNNNPPGSTVNLYSESFNNSVIHEVESKANHHQKAPPNNQMAKRILKLLDEMKESPLIDNNASSFSSDNLLNNRGLGPDHCILCKCCTGALLDV